MGYYGKIKLKWEQPLNKIMERIIYILFFNIKRAFTTIYP